MTTTAKGPPPAPFPERFSPPHGAPRHCRAVRTVLFALRILIVDSYHQGNRWTDDFKFSFQHDYAATWRRLVETFGEAGDSKRDTPLFIEYKPSETRGRCFLDNAAKTLCLLNDIKPENMGVTLDFGHSIYGGEHPAEALALIAQSPYGLYVHINDNDGRWDWDYFCGTKHYLEYVEFLYYLRRYGYDDYLTSDTSPTRWDIRRTFEANARLTNAVWNMLESVGDEFDRLMQAGDYLNTWRLIESEIFKLK